MFFYNENPEGQASEAGLTYTVSPPSLSFSQTGERLTFDVTVSGTGADNYNVSSNNNFFTVSPANGGLSGGQVITIEVTFQGNDSNQFGVISFNSDNYGSVTVGVDSSAFGGIDFGGGGPDGPPGP